ncbi:MAG: bifunctional hydroxymethylpyrimidine kinase/phosphomethylpyrimidine kinase [Bacteroidia bacterium]|nr:bifunctional hydroxymethylpyrimidine kinase/phosphomethylpyrimidine kinase [Bacteroidia bacterium]MCX7652297.1 bifunctional hydroxymethylpyrimidine kinase/phosphomethylpyrimidine kinase [Bacteroidia bacterium]MDW8416559.1 bifunctional hydroxymethylpyrimidine kinase/phosphomethylpyrimidine kinase [Bacteroidia bacterium]
MSLAPVLTIAGSDSSGGAGIQADLKTFTAVGTYGMSVITALTAQNTLGVEAVHIPPATFIEAQLNAVFSDIPPKAIKTGMLAEAHIIETIRYFLKAHGEGIPLIVDPVLVATSGARLLSEGAEASLKALAAEAYLVTPNLPEAVLLADISELPKGEKDLLSLGKLLSERYPKPYWLLKGGHSAWERHMLTSVLFRDGKLIYRFIQERLPLSRPPHGTGCTLSAAIAGYTARGYPAVEAVQKGLDFVFRALRDAPPHLGKAATLLNHTLCEGYC